MKVLENNLESSHQQSNKIIINQND